MPDISLRFNKDMLVLSTPIDYQLKAQGFNTSTDREYVCLCESELIEETYKLEQVLETPCFVSATEGITRARLAYSRFENQADDMARIAYETAAKFSPQHVFAVIGPTGLPLDSTMSSSVKQSVQQYKQATEVLMQYPFDAIFFSGFSNVADVRCALQGAKEVFDGPIMITIAPDDEGLLYDEVTLAEGFFACKEEGADVIGFVSYASPTVMKEYAGILAEVTDRPKICEIGIKENTSRLADPTDDNPYPNPDTVFDVAQVLRREGIQFLRCIGAARPSYTGSLLAAVMGTDVVTR